MNGKDQESPNEANPVSSLPDYAQIFTFLRRFGNILDLPPVSLNDLENFFLQGKFGRGPR